MPNNHYIKYLSLEDDVAAPRDTKEAIEIDQTDHQTPEVEGDDPDTVNTL